MFKKNIKILFFGTSIFALPALQKLIENNYEIAYVITQPDKPIGRKQILEASPIKKLALKYRLEVLQPEKLDASFLSLL